jgi:hypothetical protein
MFPGFMESAGRQVLYTKRRILSGTPPIGAADFRSGNALTIAYHYFGLAHDVRSITKGN